MIHLVGLPHTQFDAEAYSSCAFTAKNVRLKQMLDHIGRDCTVYWGGDKDGIVSLMSVNEQEGYFGAYSPLNLPVIHWDVNLPYWLDFNSRAIAAIRERIQPGDIVALSGGAIHQSIVDEFKDDYTCIEPGVGYEGICRGTFCCFESNAWKHHRYGAYGVNDGRPFDTVIPNMVDPSKWSMADSQGYALFVGRCIARKGPHVAAQIAARAGLPLKMMGGGVQSIEPGLILATDGTRIEGDHVEHIGATVGDDRATVYAGAALLICPTLYIGPWEGVHAEAFMSGIGVAAPDYGVFTETVPELYRYNRMSEAVSICHNLAADRGPHWRQHAIDICGFDRCCRLYEQWFDRLDSLRNDQNGWYS